MNFLRILKLWILLYILFNIQAKESLITSNNLFKKSLLVPSSKFSTELKSFQIVIFSGHSTRPLVFLLCIKCNLKMSRLPFNLTASFFCIKATAQASLQIEQNSYKNYL